MDIESYLDGSMPADEKAEFEKRLLLDAKLHEALEQFRSLKSDLDWHFAAKDVAEANALRAKMDTERRRRTRLLFAALLVLLAGLLTYWLFFQRINSPKGTSETPKPQQNTTPVTGPPSQSIPIPPTSENKPSNQPIAGKLRPNSGDLMRNLPAEDISETTLSFFQQQWAGFIPAVPEKGVWEKPVQQIRNNRALEAYLLLKKSPASDTTSYLLAVSELMLKRPSSAQEFLYPLLADKKWQLEAQYLLVWAYLLEGDEELAQASLKTLPDGFRDKQEISDYLIKR